MRRRLRWSGWALVGSGIVLGLMAFGTRDAMFEPRDPADPRIPIAVLGDSDSHGYGDSISFPRTSGLRGGVHRAATAQWTEVLAQLRSRHVDLGEVGVWGCRRPFAKTLELLGVTRRSPRKLDHRFNFAYTGSTSGNLLSGVGAQVPNLLALMARDPEAWRRGVVVLRIGIVEVGGLAMLDSMAGVEGAGVSSVQVEAVARRVVEAAERIRGLHPETALVLVGVFDNANMPAWSDRWRTPEATRCRQQVLDRYDAILRRFVDADRRAIFFDDRRWFATRWGGRDPDGWPLYRSLSVAGLEVRHGLGDGPGWTVLADGHAGLVVNTLWAQSLVSALQHLGVEIPPIRDEEVEYFLLPRYRVPR